MDRFNFIFFKAEQFAFLFVHIILKHQVIVFFFYDFLFSSDCL